MSACRGWAVGAPKHRSVGHWGCSGQKAGACAARHVAARYKARLRLRLGHKADLAHAGTLGGRHGLGHAFIAHFLVTADV